MCFCIYLLFILFCNYLNIRLAQNVAFYCYMCSLGEADFKAGVCIDAEVISLK